MKQFIGANPDESIRVHFLFVSLKPLEIELQDKDGILRMLFSRKRNNSYIVIQILCIGVIRIYILRLFSMLFKDWMRTK